MEIKTLNYVTIESGVSFVKTSDIIITDITTNNKITLELSLKNMIDLKLYLENEILSRAVNNV